MKALSYTLAIATLFTVAGTASAQLNLNSTSNAANSVGYAPPQQGQYSYAPPQQNQPAYTPPQQSQPAYTPPQQSQTSYAPPQQNRPGYAPPQQQSAYRPVGFNPQPQYQPAVPQPKLGFMGTMHYGHGLHVDSVAYNSLAKRIGLQAGDTLTHVNNVEILSFDHYLEMLRDALMYNGGQVRLTLENGNPYTQSITSPIVNVNFNLND